MLTQETLLDIIKAGRETEIKWNPNSYCYSAENGTVVGTIGRCSCVTGVPTKSHLGREFLLCCHQVALSRYLLGECSLGDYKHLVDGYFPPNKAGLNFAKNFNVTSEQQTDITWFFGIYNRAKNVEITEDTQTRQTTAKGAKGAVYSTSVNSCTCKASGKQGTVLAATGNNYTGRNSARSICKHSLKRRMQLDANWHTGILCLSIPKPQGTK